ncbi:DNA polymerase I [Ruminiclostridium herbifermentans]|uniref:DNA polymerase I n=1 Tax=Ruminiclostridium herbifermentans TaxID=2488810 RepID=A0A4V6EQ89_9FIRM|nr:DNA polymerase I [Ruminiclostridium herbifermentans]QNU68805.1 DNA polymerase I [Ruminiclostridium herbifermentans]
MIVDGNSILNRAFYGLSKTANLTNSEGLHTNAVFGFINILSKYLAEEEPKYLCVAFDLKAPTFRHKEYDQYKAQRKGMPPELAEQVPIIKQVLDAMNIKRVEVEGYEADDILGSISLCAEENGMEAILLTGDRDSLQLASETTRIKLPVTRGNKTETDEYDSQKVFEKYGVAPIKLIDVKGLMGDSSDNIPGVPGIGEKTALDLIKKFGSIEGIYENIELVEKKGVREKLEANKDLAFLCKRLATIERRMPNICNIEQYLRVDFDKDKLYDIFKKLEFKTFIDKFGLKDNTSLQPLDNMAVEHIKISSIVDLEQYINAIKSSKKMTVYYRMDISGSFVDDLCIYACEDDSLPAVFIFSKDFSSESAIKALKGIFENQEIKIYGHDLKAFIKHLKASGIEINGLAFDTMIAAYILEPTRSSYRISELSEDILNKTITPAENLYDKHGNKLQDLKIDSNTICATCAKVIFELVQALTPIIKENEQEELFYNIELPLVEVLADMELWGFKVDVEGLQNFSKELDGKISVLEDEIYMLAGENFNINSPKQLGVILFEKLGLPSAKKTKTGYSTGAEVLEKLSQKHEIIDRILEYRQLMKLKSTYADGLLTVIDKNTGKIHSSFNQTVTATGRISSTEPNLQNIPIKLELGRKIRKVFIPSDKNYVLLDADYSQIELRVLAHITGDKNMLEAFNNNEDIHTTTASKVFGIPINEVSPIMRSRAKAVNFGIVYGIGDFSLAQDIGVTKKEAKRYIDEYLNKYSSVKEYMHDTVEKGKELGFVTTIFNRRRYLPELKSSNFHMRAFGERVAMNTPIQGTAADIIKISMVKVYNELKKRKLKSRLILQVHDELIIETEKTELDEVSKLLKYCMENAVSLRVPLTVDVKYGETWYETK